MSDNDKKTFTQVRLELEDAVHQLDKMKSEYYQLSIHHKELQRKYKRLEDQMKQAKALGMGLR